MEKLCKRCDESKSLDLFNKDKNSKDGRGRLCSPCNKAYQIEYRKSKMKRWDGRVVSEKTCSKCSTTRPSSEFYKDKSKIDGISNNCKVCKKQYVTDNREDLLLKSRIYNKKMAESVKIQVDGRVCSRCKEYKLSSNFWKSKHTKDGLYTSCIECKKALESTPERKANRAKCAKEWVESNRERAREGWNNWDKNKRKTDPIYKLRRNTMHAIVNTLKKNGRGEGFERISKAIFDHLPYSAEELKQHLESQFESWMTWENWGRYEENRKTWQLDHIIPQSKMPFSNFEDDNFKKLWELSNLQPLETIANIKKGNR